jgi:hypothetical protein
LHKWKSSLYKIHLDQIEKLPSQQQQCYIESIIITMNKFSLLLLAATFMTANSSNSIRGSGLQLQEQDKQSNRRHRRLQEPTCTLIQKCNTYGPTEDHPNGYDEHVWTCKFSEEDAKHIDEGTLDIVESSAITAALADATSNGSTLTVSEAIVDTEEPRMYIPEDAHIEVRNIPTLFNAKASTTGKLKTLVIRVSDKNNVGPTVGTETLRKDVFDDDVCLS